VGSNFVTRWGSFGFFGPLSVEPRLWDQGVAQRLLDPTIELFQKWGCRHTAGRLIAGVNMSRHESYKIMVGRGFRADLMGVAMQKANAPGFNRPGVYLLDDWR
jgi:hypothetical protein